MPYANPDDRRRANRMFMRKYRAQHPDRTRAACKKWRSEHPEIVRLRDREKACRKRGITLADYDAMMIEQVGRCAICDEAMLDPRIDHDHVTDVIRGLLCNTCNRALGLFKDDPVRLLQAAEYVRRNRV